MNDYDSYSPNRRHAILAAIGLAASLAPLIACNKDTSQPPPPRPNIIFILVDTLRADRLGCYGYPDAQTPQIDALASEGVLFERRLFHSLFATEDQTEGMAAFLEKREPQFRGR